MSFTFTYRYFIVSIILLLIEVLIACFMHDSFIRPYFGDYLVVILVYCAIRTVIKTSALKAIAAALLFSYSIEVLQYFRIVDRLGLAGNTIARTIIGYGFEWWNMVAYTLGALTVLLLEGFRKKKL